MDTEKIRVDPETKEILLKCQLCKDICFIALREKDRRQCMVDCFNAVFNKQLVLNRKKKIVQRK